MLILVVKTDTLLASVTAVRWGSLLAAGKEIFSVAEMVDCWENGVADLSV